MRFLLLLGLSWVLAAQELVIRPALKQGDVLGLELTRVHLDPSRPQTNSRMLTPVQVRVSETTPAGFVLDWRQGATSTDNPELFKNPIAAAAANALKDTSLEILLDANGKLAGLRNQAEVVAKLQALGDGLIRRYGAQIDDPQRKQELETLVRRLISPAALLASAAADVQNYFSLNGAKLTQGKTIEAPGLRVTLESLDAHEAKIATVAASGSGYFVYNRAFGIMNDVVLVRSVAAGAAAARKDTFEVHLVAKPSR